MITEETLLARWRKLNSIKKEKVWEFLESLEKSEPRENYYQHPCRRWVSYFNPTYVLQESLKYLIEVEKRGISPLKIYP